jgi:hypothetical protein
MNIRPLLTAALVATLAACGGGGGSSVPAPTPTPVVAPLVSQGPSSRAVAAGASTSFTVTVVGTGPFTYQWLRDGNPLAGATGDSYATPATSLADDGARFAVAVTGPGGTVTSAAATLTVFAPPVAAASCPGSDAFSVVGDTALAVGKAGGLALAGCSGALSAVSWTQTAGPAQPLLAARTQAVSFEPDAPGTYSFDVSFRDAGNVLRNAPVSVTVSGAAAATRVLARTDQAIREGGRGSVRAWPTVAAGDTLASLTWAQIEGPAVELDTSDPARMIFTAPPVTRDTVLRFRVTLRTAGNVTDSDDVFVVVENLPDAPAGQLFADFKASRVYPYRAMSPYAADLVRCVYDPALYFNGGANNLCTLGTLPLLAQQTGGATPTIAQVMNRVLVSHDWMGARFEAFLQGQTNDDFLRLLGSVNAIVLGAHVRPSFYWSATGAIYLDADNLWLTPAERDVVSEVPDFRSGFDRELNYTGLWRYVVANQPALLFFNPASRLTRDLGYLDYELGSLMYHELAHANDFFPSAMRATAATNDLVFRVAAARLPSDNLASALPLSSQQLFGLAQVKFFGVAANDTQKAWTPRQVADFFRVDRASDEYSYSIPPGSPGPSREDLAMLFEEFMMVHRYGAQRDVAMTNKFRPGMTGSDLLVAWGQRGRVAEASIKPRLTQVLGEIAPWVSATAVDALPAPVLLREGASWTANLNPATAGAVRALSARQRALGDDPRAIERLLELRTQRLQGPGELR